MCERRCCHSPSTLSLTSNSVFLDLRNLHNTFLLNFTFSAASCRTCVSRSPLVPDTPSWCSSSLELHNWKPRLASRDPENISGDCLLFCVFCRMEVNEKTVRPRTFSPGNDRRYHGSLLILPNVCRQQATRKVANDAGVDFVGPLPQSANRTGGYNRICVVIGFIDIRGTPDTIKTDLPGNQHC